MVNDLLHISSTLLAVEGNSLLTREVFGNISKSSQLLFYLLAVAALMSFGYGVYRRTRLWRVGRIREPKCGFGVGLKRFFQEVVLQRRVRGRGLASIAHLLLFSGFGVLLIGTTLIAIEHVLAGMLGREPTNPVFHHGIYFAIYEFVMDTFGVAFLIGCLLFAKRRLVRPPSVGHTVLDWGVLVSFFVIGVTGFLLEGLRIIREQPDLPGFSFVGFAAARVFEAFGTTPANVNAVHVSLWWFHAILALGIVAAFPYARLMHSLAGLLNLVTNNKQLGVMAPCSIEEVEQTGRFGAGQLADFNWQQLLELDACVSCGRCEEACPAFEAGKPLSPKAVVQDVWSHLNTVGPIVLATRANADASDGDEALEISRKRLHGDVIDDETLWSCTTCSACVDVCPLRVNPLTLITDMRRHLIGEGELRGAPAAALQKTERSGNPWGLPQDERFAWAEGLDVPTVKTNPGFEVLYWIGCAAAYDRRIQKVARSVVRLLKLAKVNFAVCGPEERCTGESARRMGDEFVFQDLARQNIETLGRHQVKKIVTHCPHCFNSLKNDYPQFGGEYEVVHHSQFLADLVQNGRLRIEASDESGEKTTYHDPCYLARVNNVVDPPRQLIQLSMSSSTGTANITEMPRNGKQTACCGAGGGRMWFDDSAAQRIGSGRVEEALATGAETIAVSCPFCLIMMNDGIAAKGRDVQVRDIAEVLADAAAQADTRGT